MSDAMDARPQDTVEPLLDVVMRFARGSIGAKVVMAVTGVMLWGFILVHLAANLMVFAGPDTVNNYGASLRSAPALLWTARLGLIAAFGLHIFSAIRCARLNAEARPVAYAFAPRTPVRTAAVTMLLSGGTVLAFLLFHLAHFTWHVTHPEHVRTVMLYGREVTDVYTMVIKGFQVPWIAGFYIVGQVLLAGHLSHGLYSMFQHLGLYGQKTWTPFLKVAANTIAWGVCLAFCSIPLSILFGIVTLPS